MVRQYNPPRGHGELPLLARVLYVRTRNFYNLAMKIILNGRDYELPANTTIAQLIELRDIKTPAYAVERNREVIFRNQHAGTKLEENDKVEIVVAVGGG